MDWILYFVLGAIGYVVCSRLAFILLWENMKENARRRTYRNYLDGGDLTFTIFMSCLGPVSLIAALIIHAIDNPSPRSKEAVWRADDDAEQ